MPPGRRRAKMFMLMSAPVCDDTSSMISEMSCNSWRTVAPDSLRTSNCSAARVAIVLAEVPPSMRPSTMVVRGRSGVGISSIRLMMSLRVEMAPPAPNRVQSYSSGTSQAISPRIMPMEV